MSRVRTVFDFGFLWNYKSVFTHSTAFIGLYKFHCAQGPLISFQELLRSHVWINKFIFQMPGVFFFVRVWFVGSSDGIKKLQMLHKHQLPGLCCEIRYFSNSFSTLRHSFNYLFIYPFIHFTYVYSFKGQAWVSVGESVWIGLNPKGYLYMQSNTTLQSRTLTLQTWFSSNLFCERLLQRWILFAAGCFSIAGQLSV